MNSQNNPLQSAPDFEKMVWSCPCCKQQRQDKYLKVSSHDISQLFNCDTGTAFVNCRYCADMPGCKEKAIDRTWVINNILKKNVGELPMTCNVI